MRRVTGALGLAAVLVAALTLPGCAVLGDRSESADGDGSATQAPSPAAPSVPSDGAAVTPSPSLDPAAPTGWGPTAGELDQATSLVAAMTLEEQVATVLMPGFWGYAGDRPTAAEVAQNQVMHGADSIVDVLAAQPFSGVFLRPEVIADADQIGALAETLHEAGDGPDGLPLLVSIDQEGGVVQRLREGVPAVPSAASVGITGDPAYARKVARENGRTLARLGVTMVFAPVADVDPDGRSVIGTRAYSDDPDDAAEMVTASVKGYLQAGVLPVVKHFPGLGSVRGDSHRRLPVQRKSVAGLVRTDLVPFAAAVRAGAPAAMVAHVAVKALDPGVPASVSPTVLQTLLRDELGFDGVAITDSQGMGPIFATYGPGEGAVRSLLAGDDLVLNSPNPTKARRAVTRAVRDGRLSTDRLLEAATRVTALRIYQQRLAAR